MIHSIVVCHHNAAAFAVLATEAGVQVRVGRRAGGWVRLGGCGAGSVCGRVSVGDPDVRVRACVPCAPQHRRQQQSSASAAAVANCMHVPESRRHTFTCMFPGLPPHNIHTRLHRIASHTQSRVLFPCAPVLLS